MLNTPVKTTHAELQKIVRAVTQLKQLEAENEAKAGEFSGELAAIPDYGALLSAAELDKLTGVTDADESAQRITALKAEQATVAKRKQQIDADLAKCRSMLADIRSRISEHERKIPELREQARSAMREYIRGLIDKEAKKLAKVLPSLAESYVEINSLAGIMWTLGGDAGHFEHRESAIRMPWSDHYPQDDRGRVFHGLMLEDRITEQGERLEAALRENFPESFVKP